MRADLPTRGRGIDDGLAARLHDPLWMLARQWQFGEFRHENVGSPARVELTTEAHRIDQWQPGFAGAEWASYDPARTPLERLVEQHGGGPTPRLRLEGGLRLKRLLASPQDLAAFARRCPFADAPLLDDADRLIRRGLPDGALLAEVLERVSTGAGADLGPLATPGPRLAEIAGEWLEWWRGRLPAPIPADRDCWNDNRLEHTFALRASGLPEVELRASGHAGGRLDWSAVDAVEAFPGIMGGPGGGPVTIEHRGIPAPARFGGMPATRFWELEDAQFDPGSVDAAPIDLGRLLLVGYATVYGNDWFVAPVSVPAGSLSRVTRFDVHDVFGRVTPLTAIGADQDGWNLFGLTMADRPLEPDQERPTSPWFFLAPALPGSLEGAPTDVVMLLRDEMANVAWAVEAIVGDDQGRPRDRFAQWAARDVPPPVDGPTYRVATEVPDHWFPLVPEQLADGESVRLRLTSLARPSGRESPVGTLLPAGDLWLYEEEVPRSGVQVTRTWQHARWHDGSRHVWQARRRTTGRGEGSSGLRFDAVEG